MADLFSQFLPVGPVSAPANAAPPPKAGKSNPKSSAPPDPESQPQRQVARRLGTHGAMILRDKIKVEYVSQREKWNAHIGKVTTAFSIALGKQSGVLQEARNELQTKGELALFVFSLVCVGVMRWAGGFVQYKVAPKYLSEYKHRNIVINANSPSNKGMIDLGRSFIQIGEVDYDKQIAAFVGGLTQDVGNRALGYLSPKFKNGDPWKGVADGDQVSLVRITESTLKEALADGTKVVEDQMDQAVFWMQQSPDFGERWALFCNGNESVARNRIRQHFQDLRDKWAKNWPYFGTDPKPFTQSVLADSFERGLWAEYINGYFTDYFKRNGFTRDDVFTKRADEKLYGPKEGPGYGPDYAILMYYLGIANALIVELKRLNVVIAETKKGGIEQFNRVVSKEGPAPAVQVEDDLDNFDEIRSLWQWAENYPAATATSVKSAGAEGIPRTLESIPSY